MDRFTKDANRNLSNHKSGSNGIALNSMEEKGPLVTFEENSANTSNEDLNFTLRIYKEYKIRIYKPLIPLKLALFCFFGAGAALQPFLTVYFKQRGLTLSELSTIYMVTPVVQFLGPTLSGVIADKLGRSKPVLVVNLLITILLIVGILLVPSMKFSSCEPQEMDLKCHRQQFDRLIAKTKCDIPEDVIKVHFCNVHCPENVTTYCYGRNLICEILAGNEEFGNFSLTVHLNDSFTIAKECFYNVNSLSHKNTTYSWCNIPHKMYCKISCIINHSKECEADTDSRDSLLILNMVLLILFLTTFSNCYRVMDVTSMALVKEHNSDFGRERFFSILGVLVWSPVSGFIVNLTTIEGEPKNYAAAMYLYIGMICLTLGVIYKLKVQIKSPGKRMWKKSVTLLKNPDVIAFILVLFVLGTTWAFIKNFMFWYLEELNTPSFLLGVIPAVASLYGLPFLLTSRWWVKKIGPTQIFVLGLLGHVANAMGYSFLYDPWLTLLLEATGIVTYHLLWVAVIVYSSDLAPEGLTATVLSSAGGLHYGIGKCSGSLVGGLVMSAFGGRIAFRVMAVICLISSVLYSVYLYMRRTRFAMKQDLNDKGVTEKATCKSEGEPAGNDVLGNKRNETIFTNMTL